LFAVTFDDAYLSLASGAVMRSIEAGLPVCVFVVSGASDRGARFWWDRLETVLPLVATERWREFLHQIGSPAEYDSPAAEALGSERSLRQWVLGHHAGRWPSEADAALAALERDTRALAPDRAMTFHEIDTLVARGRVEIGVHTVSHPVLPLLPDETVRAELRDCHATLRERWPETLPWAAAPFGLYDGRTHRLALEAGLHGFLSLHRHTLAHATLTHGLPRINISERLPRWKLGLMMRGVGSLHARSSARRVDYPALPGRGGAYFQGIEPTIDV
jgi:peptidoglycan/xylan/chitin deacetylase (PgdA/CDA1 family)